MERQRGCKQYARIAGTAFLVIFFVVFAASAYADEYDVYLSNQHVDGKVVVRKGTIYFPVIPLAKAMKLNLGTSRGMIWVGSQPGEGIKGKLFLNGAPFADIIAAKDGTVYASLSDFTRVFGYKILVNKTTQIIDIIPEDRPTSRKEYLEKEMRDINKLLPDPLIESLKQQPQLRDYLVKIKDWFIQSTIAQDKAVEELELGFNETQNIRQYQDFYDSIAHISKGFQLDVDSESGLQKSFAQIVPPKEFENSHAILKRMVDRFSAYESLSQEGVVLVNELHPHTELRGEEYITSVDNNVWMQIKQLGPRYDAIDKEQSEDYLRYKEVLDGELERITLSPVSKLN